VEGRNHLPPNLYLDGFFLKSNSIFLNIMGVLKHSSTLNKILLFTMGRPKGSLNKLTAEVKENLQGILTKVIYSLDVDTMSTSEKLKYMQIVTQYIMPRLKAVYKQESNEQDIPLFLDVKEYDEETGEIVTTESYETVWNKLHHK